MLKFFFLFQVKFNSLLCRTKSFGPFIFGYENSIQSLGLTNTAFNPIQIVIINEVTILMMSAKVANSGLLKIKEFWNKVYYDIYYVYDVTKKILSLDANNIVDVVMWPKFGNSSIYLYISNIQVYSLKMVTGKCNRNISIFL